MCPNPSSIHNSPCFPGAGAPYLQVSPFPPSFHILTSFPFGPWDVPLKVTMSFLALSIPGFLREPLWDPPVLASSRWLCACWSAGLSRLVGPQQASGQSQAEHHQYQASVEPFWSGGEDSASSHWAGPGGCVDKGTHCLHVRGLLLATGRREGETEQRDQLQGRGKTMGVMHELIWFHIHLYQLFCPKVGRYQNVGATRAREKMERNPGRSKKAPFNTPAHPFHEGLMC